MLGLKKLYREELLQLALLLSLLRVDPESYLGIDIQRIGVGSLDLNNGSGWQTDSHTIAVHRPMYIHPKNPDSMLLNYERDLFEELNSLGRYNRMNLQQNNIHAYLLNVDDNGRDPAVAGSSIVDSTDLRRNVTSPDPPSDAQTSVAPVETAELTQEDMDLIEVLWKQDVDLGFTLVDPEPPEQSSSKIEKESPDEIEKLKALQAVNATINENDTKNNVEKQKKEEKEEVKEEEEEEDDPWAGLSYTVDLETGEYILIGSSSSGPGSGSGSGNCNNITENNNNINPNVVQDDQLLSTHLNLHEHQSSINENSLGLDDNFGLEDDFPSELLNGSLLCGTGVDGLLSNDSLGLPDGFNLEEALQLVGLNEVQPHEEIKSEEKQEKNCAKSLDTSGNLKDKITSSSCNKDNDIKNEIKHDKDDEDDDDNDEEDEDADDDDDDDDDNEMIHTPQFHHPHHRSFQGRMPFVRALSMEQPWQELQSLLGPDHFTHPPHPGYLNHGVSHHHHHHHYNNQRNVLLHNATLAPPIGDLNSTGPYHNVGGASNLGSAVATSMNLTNSSEPMGPDNSTAYKTEPNDMMFYHTPTSDTINQTSDGFFSSLLDDELHLVDMAMNEGMYTMRMLDNSSNNASGPTSAATSLPSVQIAGGTATNTPTIITNLPGVTDERMDASSDSAVSSMGSERVPSLSDGEWMETGSNSSHTQADSHYSMDYASKYRMPYECSYSVSGRNGGSPRCQNERMPPVAQKKHQMFAKRYFQEQGTCSPLSASAHPTTPVKYDYDVQTVGAGAPGNAYSGPIEGAAGIQSELKYSCSVDFSRHQTVPLLPGRTALEHVHHNHTYHLPPDTSGAMQRPLSRDKKARKHEADEHLTRDEKRARALNVPISVHDIINLPMDEFNERLSKYDLSEAQLSLIRDIRRRGKNKVAAQNCRKRKLDQIISLADQVKEMRDRKMRLIRERDFMLLERQRVKDKFSQLYRHVFQSLRDPDGNQYNPYEYSLQQSADGNILLVPRNQTNPHHSRQCSSTMESKNKPEPEHKE